MENFSVNTSFVSEKVNKIRFCPEELTDTTTFVTGSAGMRQNTLKFWKMLKNDLMESDVADDELIMGQQHDTKPKSTSSFDVTDSVTGVEFVDYNNFAATTADGSLHLTYVTRDREADNMKRHFRLDDLHDFACTGLAVLDEDCVTVGEDGAWNLVSCVTQRVVKTNKRADSTGISCVAFVSQKELLTGNSMGAVKVFDVTAKQEKPVVSLTVSCEGEKTFNRVTCICSHPTQSHIVLVGSEEGSITVFDLRQPGVPASYLSPHTAAINEIAFHPTEPTKLFTGSETGDLWQWSQVAFPVINGFGQSVDLGTENPWLDGERAKSSINVTALINGSGNSAGINSFDSFKNKVIAAGDNEAVYLIEQMY